eukprot:9559962-Karenia_brevis.AAC.1
MTESKWLQYAECVTHRVHCRHVGAVCKGGIYLVSIYLWTKEGLSKRNLDLLQAVAQVISQLRAPWVLAGDWNIEPAALEKS